MGCKVRVTDISVSQQYLPSPGEVIVSVQAKVEDVDVTITKTELAVAAAAIAVALCLFGVTCPNAVAVALGLYQLLTVLGVDRLEICYGAGVGLGLEEGPYSVKIKDVEYSDGDTLYTIEDWEHVLSVGGYIPFIASLPAVKGSTHMLKATLEFERCGTYKICAYETHFGALGDVFHEDKKCTYVYVCQQPPKQPGEPGWLEETSIPAVVACGLGLLGLVGGILVGSGKQEESPRRKK